MEHGGDLLSYRNYYEGELIDFSSNINPLGPPEDLFAEIKKGFDNISRYPDIKYRELKSSIAEYLKCNSENVVVGNGAIDLINNFILLFSRTIIFVPSFSEYEKRGLINGKETVSLRYRDDFTIDLDELEKNVKPQDLVILGNPNNPTGLRIDEKTLVALYEIVNKKDGFLLLDEAFYEFCPEDYDSIEIFKDYSFKKVGIIRAATKFFALPGIRLGYGCVSEDMVKKYERVEIPWSVNALADIAGKTIFKDKSYIKKSKEYMEKERSFMLNELSKIEGIKPFTTHANFILVKLLKWDEEYVFDFFAKRGVIIRRCSNFKGLDSSFIRVAVKDRDSNIRLIDIFKELEQIS